MSSPSWYLPQYLQLASYLTLKLICALNGAEPGKRHHVFHVSWRWLIRQKQFSCSRVGAVERNVPSVNTATRINCLIVWTSVTVQCCTMLHVPRNSIVVWKVPRFRPFVFLVRATCRWKWDWNIGGMTLRGVGGWRKAETHLHDTQTPGPYRAVNTLRLGYTKSQLMLYREIIAVCSEIHTKHINTLCGQNVELLNVKLAIYIVTTRRW